MASKLAIKANTWNTANFITDLLIFSPQNRRMTLLVALFEEYHSSEDFPLLFQMQQKSTSRFKGSMTKVLKGRLKLK